MKRSIHIIGIAALIAAATSVALAGGPLYTYDAENRIPYAWHLDTWPGGAVPFYLDGGPLGRLSESIADPLAISAYAEWDNVPTSSVLTQYAGKLSTLGLPADIDQSNALEVLGAWNGGGVHVIYDNDGLILQNVLGVSRFAVLGITGIEWSAPDSNEILEAWTVLNGSRVSSTDPNGVSFRGVMTHEFGHSLGLAHTTTNGQVQVASMGGNNDQAEARDCAAPWPTAAKPANSDIETMFVSINVASTGNGADMATVDRMDDIAAISDLYPAPGWPDSYGTIRGKIFTTDLPPAHATEITGVNVIARNVANPFTDATSYLSGQVSKGLAGPDGEFVLHGLTPGATYVIYVDNVLGGAYSVPRLIVLPGPEEYYNGADESGNGETDDRCAWTPITVGAGTSTVANITFNKVKGAPVFVPAPNLGIPTDITPDGGTVVGTASTQGPVFVWNVGTGGFDTIGGEATGGQPGISDDGTRIAFSVRNPSGVIQPAVWEGGDWTLVPLWPNAVAPCGTGANAAWGSAYDISGDGSTVVGLSYANGCSQTTGSIRGFRSKSGVSEQLPKYPVNTGRAGRANAVNYDGSVIVGWDDASGRLGVYWTVAPDGTVSPTNMISPDITTYFAGESIDVTRDGSTIIGLTAGERVGGARDPWTYTQAGGIQALPNFPNGQGGAGAISDDGRVISGYSDVRVGTVVTRIPTIWTSELGTVDFNLFMNSQGSYAQDFLISNPTAMSADGRTHTGWGTTVFGQVGWVLQTPKAVMCHKSPGNPNAVAHTIDVSFPGGMADHLAHGDTLGLCQTGGM